MKEFILLAHVTFGIFCFSAALWVFVEVLNAGNGNPSRVRWISRVGAVCMWISFLLGGYWYVLFYASDKALILNGPWPLAHKFFMETKEHLVIMLPLLATYLPIAVNHDLAANKIARQLALWSAGGLALLLLAVEGEGAIISMGVKLSLLSAHP